MEILQRLFHGEHDMIHFFGEHLVGHAGERILLVNGTGNSQMCRCMQNRPCHIAAGSDCHIRLELPDDLAGTGLRGRKIIRCLDIALDVFPAQLPLKAGDVHGFQPISSLRNQTCFHSVGRSHKEKLRRRIMFPDNGGDCQRRIDMAAGSASCQ